MILADFHVHSCFCDGKDTPEELIQSAVDKGLKKLGILVHSFIDFEPGGSASLKKTAEFIKTINCLKLKYKDKIELFCGVEQDLFSKTSYSQFDYIIASVHFFKKGDKFYPIDLSKEIFIKAIDEFFDGDAYSAIEWYFNAVVEAVEKIKPTIIGHFDLISKFNENSALFDEKNQRYVSAYENAIQKLLRFNIPFEINVGAISRGYRSFPYPSLDIITYIKENGGKFVLSSDAHCRENIAYEFSKWQKIINFNNIIAF